MRSRLPGLLAVVAVLMLAAVVARGQSAVPTGRSTPWFAWLRLPAFELAGPSGVVGGPGSDDALGWSAYLGWTVLLLPVLLLLIAIGAAIWISLTQRRIRVPSPVHPGEQQAYADLDPVAPWLGAARSARAVLAEHEGAAPGDGVIAAWLELERMAAAGGAGRSPHQTPTEFTTMLSTGNAAADDALDRLRRLYQLARFGPPGMVGQPQVELARAALDEIVLLLDAGAAVR